MSETRFERIIRFSPAFDRRHSDPAKNYGIHDVHIYFCVKGEKGCAIFSMGTEWFLPETNSWMIECSQRIGAREKWQPRGNAVCYCSPTPLHDWQVNNGRENCDWLGCTCYGDCSYTISDTVVQLLISKGSDAVWEWLENWYNETFYPKQLEQ